MSNTNFIILYFKVKLSFEGLYTDGYVFIYFLKNIETVFKSNNKICFRKNSPPEKYKLSLFR